MHFFGGSASRGADKVMEATEACMFGCGSYYVIFTCCFVMFHVLRAILVLEYNVQPVIPPANGENGMAGSCTQVQHVFKHVSRLIFHMRSRYSFVLQGDHLAFHICICDGNFRFHFRHFATPQLFFREEQWILPLSIGVPRVSHPVRKLTLDCRHTAVNWLRTGLIMLPFRVKFDQILI